MRIEFYVCMWGEKATKLAVQNKHFQAPLVAFTLSLLLSLLQNDFDWRRRRSTFYDRLVVARHQVLMLPVFASISTVRVWQCLSKVIFDGFHFIIVVRLCSQLSGCLSYSLKSICHANQFSMCTNFPFFSRRWTIQIRTGRYVKLQNCNAIDHQSGEFSSFSTLFLSYNSFLFPFRWRRTIMERTNVCRGIPSARRRVQLNFIVRIEGFFRSFSVVCTELIKFLFRTDFQTFQDEGTTPSTLQITAWRIEKVNDDSNNFPVHVAFGKLSNSNPYCQQQVASTIGIRRTVWLSRMTFLMEK